jgi:FKBP-type peptidyl-prolyl cis-trans isomerase SlyD
MAAETIAKDTVVGIDYRLTVTDGTEVDTTRGREPLEYLHGHANIIPGLETALEGARVGDRFDLMFAPEDAYGKRDAQREIEVTRQQLGFEPEVGTVVQAQLPDGREQHLLIAKVEGETVTLDGNHPLAGESLRFEVSVASLRDATADEISKGYVD